MEITPLLDVPVGATVTVKVRGTDMTLEAELIGYVEGWPEVRFSDDSTCIVRPSSITHLMGQTSRDELVRLHKSVSSRIDRLATILSRLRGEGE